MLDRLREITEVFQELSASKGFLLAIVAFAGGVSRLVMKSLQGTSAISIWQVFGTLFVATVVGVLVGFISSHYIKERQDLVVGAAFVGGYLWKKILDKLETIDAGAFIRYLRKEDRK